MLKVRQTIRLHPTQQAFRQSNALFRGFVGGRSGRCFLG